MSATHLTIDGRRVEAAPGATVLDAARSLGVDIPTLCFAGGLPPFASCMVCLVRERKSGQLIPSCSAPAAEGMDVETSGPEVDEARKAALELLLSEHAGDCEGPCRRGCPARMNIPLMIRRIRAGEFDLALRTVKEHIPIPAVLGRICPAPCEKVCRRARRDGAVAICLLKRFVADVDGASGSPWRPPSVPETGRRVAVVGAGPAGLTAACYVRRRGHACALFEKAETAGGGLRSGVPEARLPREVLEKEIDLLLREGIELRTGVDIGRDVSLDALRAEFDAVILAIGKVGGADPVFGLPIRGHGFACDRETLRTERDGLFAAGGAVRPLSMAVSAVADGRLAAESVHRFLAGRQGSPPARAFDSRLGSLEEGEMEAFLVEATADGPVRPAGGTERGFDAGEAMREAARCLRCDCSKADACRLREYATRYGAKPSAYGGGRRKRFERILQHPDIIYEPGKCIACGLCVRIAEKAREPLGLTFIGRGFDVRVGVPFRASLAEGLSRVAQECVLACPTAALARR